MEATRQTLELAASVSKFDIIELWYEDPFNSFECKFSYASEAVQKEFESVIVGHYSHHSREHVISPQLCQRAKESVDKFCWLPRDKIISVPGILPIKTELSIFLDNDGIKSNVFLVCFSFSELRMNIRMIQYLAGLTLSVYISAYFLDDERAGNDLDVVHGMSSRLGKPRSDSISILSDLSKPHLSKAVSERMGGGESKTIGDSSLRKSYSSFSSRTDSAKDFAREGTDSSQKNAPTWKPAREFSYPIAQVAVLKNVEKLSIGQFGNMQYFASGTNSDVYRATYNDMDVAVKMLQKKHANSSAAQQDLNMEHGMLVRLSHENIIDILAVGESPQRFIALEYLGGGTLQRLLHDEAKSNSVMNFSSLFTKKKQALTLLQALVMARDMASALDYLHERCCADASIIHRDLKPENAGFTESMKLKLFDFGLMTCVMKPSTIFDMYEMSGFTGSLRYMAPEVARKKPYNQKVDVYSFGIMLWEMITGKLPFKGVVREEFMTEVVGKSFRPNIPKNLSPVLANLLRDCWDVNPLRRPSFESILITLGAAIVETGESSAPVLLSGSRRAAYSSKK